VKEMFSEKTDKLKKLSLLYVEDEEDIRKNYIDIFSHYFNVVYPAKDGTEAIELYNKNIPDVIILDYILPYFNGMEIAKKIRETNKKSIIIFTTARLDSKDVNDYKELDILEVLIKPVITEDLIKLLEKISDKVFT